MYMSDSEKDIAHQPLSKPEPVTSTQESDESASLLALLRAELADVKRQIDLTYQAPMGGHKYCEYCGQPWVDNAHYCPANKRMLARL